MDKRKAAGIRHEKEVSYYLQRAIKDKKETYLFNDITFKNECGGVQIDHLVLHPYGFLIVESKSVYGEIRVNTHGEWSRSFNGKWYGMKSPIQQAELQREAILELLIKNKEDLLGKALGVLSYGFKGRQWDVLTAVSSSAIINRASLPDQLSDAIVKAEFIGKRVDALAKSNSLSSPSFSSKQMNRLVTFFRSISSLDTPEVSDDASYHVSQSKGATIEDSVSTLCCKHCGHNELTGAYGKYGYYGICQRCNKNTAMPRQCPSCKSKEGKPRKKKETFFYDCPACGEQTTLIG